MIEQIDPTLMERIADHVHQGWATEKQRQGFADHIYVDVCAACEAPISGSHCGKSGCYFPKSKHHADMLPYADLSENVKEYDRATVRAVFAGIDAAGNVVVPAETLRQLRAALAWYADPEHYDEDGRPGERRLAAFEATAE